MRQQRDVVLVRVVLVQEVIDALEQVLEPQQRAHALAQGILVADHDAGPAAAGCGLLARSIQQNPKKIKGLVRG